MMLFNSINVLGASLAVVVAETIHGVALVNRHGDRTSKHYPDYQLTNLGYRQSFDAGSFFRSTYVANGAPKKILGMSPDAYVYTQLYAAAPDQQILLKTTTAFLQGVYPPLSDINALSLGTETINNGSTYTTAANGFQYIFLRGRQATSPDTMWIKGDELCPAFTNASVTFKQTPQYLSLLETTKTFYAKFWSVLQNVYDYTQKDMTFAKAYDIFDLINVASIHNKTVTSNVTSDELFQLRTLADIAEFNSNFNASQSNRNIGGRALAGAIYMQLNQTLSSKGALKFSVFTPSYNNILSLFGLTKLTAASQDFYGLPPYASTLSFELFTPTTMSSFPTNLDDLSVRAVFRNGSDGGAPLVAFPLFGGSSTSMSWKDFSAEMLKFSITSTGQWCNTCNSTAAFCSSSVTNAGAATTVTATASVSAAASNGKEMSNAVAGVIGAMVMLGVFIIVGMVFLLRRPIGRKNKGAATDSVVSGAEKRPSLTSSVSEV
ncbi:histidine phosphatase superfamily [Tricladium varicosporioides]|nr:histidine phosphatase superfamily [Hymenoscyphus varicosporioides]